MIGYKNDQLMKYPSLSIIIPCRNESKFIAKCLDSIIVNDYPNEKFEILVIDGMSDDGTRRVVRRYTRNNPNIRLLDNPKRIAPTALNIGVRESTSDYVLILSAHSEVDKNFLRANVESIHNYRVDCVGGVIKTLSANDTALGQSIAFALSHPFGIGNSYFRIGTSKSRFVDTVPFGCYRRDIFARVGFFDEELIRNQDDEFNLRLIRNGGKILLVPKIVSYYYARGNLSKLWRMFFQYGYFKPLVASKVGGILTIRQIVPVFLITTLTCSLIAGLFYRPMLWLFILTTMLYILVNVIVSFGIARRTGLKHLLWLIASFSTLHLSYGYGYLKGIIDYYILKKHKHIADLKISR